MTFREFLQLEDGFSVYGNPKVVNSPLKVIKTQIKMCKPPKDGKTSVGRISASNKKSIKPSRPASLQGSSIQTIKSVL